MSKAIEDVLRSPRKPKVKTALLAEALLQGRIKVKEFIAFFESAKDTDKGTCADVMKHVSARRPGMLGPNLEVLVRYVDYPAPRVWWGVPETIGNLAAEYPRPSARAVPALLRNAADPSTVVRWCAAYALTAIAEADPSARKTLLPKLRRVAEKETNNGVFKVYARLLQLK